MLRPILVLASLSLWAHFPTTARADFIGTGSFTAGTNTSPTGNGNLVSSSASGGSQNDDYTGIGASNPNQASLTLDVFALHQPFTINVATSNAFIFTGPGAEYFFTVTINNMLGDNGVQPVSLGDSIGPIFVRILGAASGLTTPATFDSPANPFPTSTPYGYWYNPAYQTPTTLFFGGASGSGGEIPYHGSETFTFSIDIPTTANLVGGFTLEFTANPEPGSLALAGLLGVPGVLALRRRRKHQLSELPAGQN